MFKRFVFGCACAVCVFFAGCNGQTPSASTVYRGACSAARSACRVVDTVCPNASSGGEQ